MDEKSPFDYQKPTDAMIPVIQSTRDVFKVAHQHLLSLPETRERSIAITKLEEAAMWAVKGIVFNHSETEFGTQTVN